MKFSIAILLLTFVFVSNSSCEKKDIIEMHFNETGCANPWSVSSSDPDYQIKINDYLETIGVDIKTISITNDGPWSGCFACFCTTGRKINISIYEKDKTIVEGIGFTTN
jgi:hypothetical protein